MKVENLTFLEGHGLEDRKTRKEAIHYIQKELNQTSTVNIVFVLNHDTGIEEASNQIQMVLTKYIDRINHHWIVFNKYPHTDHENKKLMSHFQFNGFRPVGIFLPEIKSSVQNQEVINNLKGILNANNVLNNGKEKVEGTTMLFYTQRIFIKYGLSK